MKNFLDNQAPPPLEGTKKELTKHPLMPTAEPTFPTDNAYLLIRIAGDLAPNLADKPQDQAAALRMAWQMVKAYHPGNEADVTTAARIVSLSMTQLDLLR